MSESDPPQSPRIRSHEGLLPDAAQLQIYESIVPGSAKRMLDQWEQENQHQRLMELRGLNYALGVALSFLLISFVVIMTGILQHEAAGTVSGTVLGTVDIVALVSVFLYRQSKQ